MPSRPCYRVVLAKEDFKFSAAHFTLWSGGGGELLHGHNYQVKVELAGGELHDAGLLVDLEQGKRVIPGLCGRLDSRTLLPAASDRLLCTRRRGTLEGQLGGRCDGFRAAGPPL